MELQGRYGKSHTTSACPSVLPVNGQDLAIENQLNSPLVVSNDKVFSFPSKAIVGAFSTGFEIQHIAASSDFIFTATKCGTIEIWLRERVSRVASIKMACGGHHKITSLASDFDGGSALCRFLRR